MPGTVGSTTIRSPYEKMQEAIDRIIDMDSITKAIVQLAEHAIMQTPEEESIGFVDAFNEGIEVADSNGDATAVGQLPHYLETETMGTEARLTRDMAGFGFMAGFLVSRMMDREPVVT